MLIVSREMGSRPLGVILTVRRAVFIWGETEVMVPWRIVPLSLCQLRFDVFKGKETHHSSTQSSPSRWRIS